MKRIIITTGDRGGIGLEVTCKALRRIQIPQSSQVIVVAGNDSRSRRTWETFALNQDARVLGIDKWDSALDTKRGRSGLSVLPSKNPEAVWFQKAVQLALSGAVDGVVTGPLSKQSFARAGLDVMGHTGLLAKMSGQKVVQGYCGNQLNLVLATHHIPLKSVELALTKSTVLDAIAAADELRRTLPSALRGKPVAILGLNPHAGENGRIGRFERKLGQWLPHHVIGPLSPDTAFTANSRGRYSVAVALYHDQGLIPFKLLHGQDSGFQLSLALPFVRTSVDHGTATDIAGTGKANPGSMIFAIRGAFKLVNRR